MYKKWKFLSLGLVGAALVVLILLVAEQRPRLFDGILGLQDAPHLSDAELIGNFYRHRAEFEQLREMIVQDKGLSLVDNNRTLPEILESIHVPLSRIKEYRTLLKNLGIRGGITASDDRGYIELTASFHGFVTHNSQKGYIYEDRRPDAKSSKRLVAELDQFTERETGSGIRHLDGNWYLFFEGY